MSRSFRDLQPHEVLALAIAVESRNAQRYDSFALLFAGDEAGSLFLEMRDEELAHRNALQVMYHSRFGDRPCALDEADVDEVVEAVDIDDAEHLIFDSMTRSKVFEAALRAELGAQQFYTALSESVQDEELLALYRRLAAYEQGHLTALENRIHSSGAGKGNNDHGRAKTTH
jgi:rubrerythrin